MFINLTNHPSSGWSEEQLNAAQAYGEIVDIPFPIVNEKSTEGEIRRLADKYLAIIKSKGRPQDLTVHIMGEQTFCYALIAKLQKEGIRCLASCTEHDSFINDAGQKVSVFHFARFREYVPPRAVRWWIKLKKAICSIFKKRTLKKEPFSWIAIILVLAAEVLMLVFPHIHWCLLMALFVLLVLFWVVCKLSGLTFSIRSTISKLLANAISPTLLGTIYLLTFVIHIGWLGNAVHGLFSETGNALCNVLFSTLACILGLVALVFFFPNGKEEKDKEVKETIVSAISMIGLPRTRDYSELNLRPLVRILQGRQINNCELLILRSDFNKMSDTDLSKNIKDVMEFLFSYEKEGKAIWPDSLKGKSVADLLEGKQRVTEQMELLIKIVALIEFPTQEEEIENLTFDWTDPCNYNDFKSCHDVLTTKIERKDDNKHRLICYVSPGTALVGSLITLMAIDGDRELYYYSQDRSKEDSERLMPVNKNDIPLKNLLSQALEKLG
ncbi:MAG: OPT/YSL family transporter [Bacteroidaceae bacterium]|nr:OPT/YSL family transporter [Bacteroidaceae bacterium]